MRLRPAAALFALVWLLPVVASAQSLAEQSAFDYLRRDAARHGLSAADAAHLVATDQSVSRRSGVTHVYLHQAVDGVPVVAGQMTVNVLRDGRILNAAGQLVPGLAARLERGAASVTPVEAVAAIASATAAQSRVRPTEAFTLVEAAAAPGARAVVSDGGIARLPVLARLVYDDDGTGAIVPMWDATLYLKGAAGDWRGLVDARTGRVVRTMDLLDRDVFVSAPRAVRQGTAAAPSAALTSAPAPMGAPFLAAVEQATGAVAGGGASYRVYPYPITDPFFSTPAWPADGRTVASGDEDATASPFGWHDTDGAAGAEFTTTRGNNTHSYRDRDDDEAPDPGTTPDGGAGLSFDFPINFTQDPALYTGASVTNLFYWNNLIHDVTYGYGFDEASGNFQSNNYGNGGVANDFVDSESQSGADICNEFNPCSNNANFSTSPDGQRPRMQMYTGINFSVEMDGSLDNHVILHEYGHGITKRLTGGASTTSCLTNAEQMGEGWSDWYGLMMTMEPTDTRTTSRPVGAFLFHDDRPGGIRSAPYSTNFAVNDFTYGRTNNASLPAPHGVGFVWATILWEATWDLIAAHGFDADIWNADGLAGNQVMLNLVTEGLKNQPCSPGFVTGRDAILAADVALYNGAHTDLLWAAFARRGLGIGASQGSPDSRSDQIEDFAEPEAIAPAPVTDLAATPNGDFVTLTFTATGDDGAVGTATSYDVRYATTPIVTVADFNAATAATGEPTPQAAGATETFVLPGLTFNTIYYVALKVADNSFNISDLSNVVQVTTLGAPVANVPTSVVTAGVTGPGQTTTATVTLGNSGPSGLRYTVSLAEATRRPAPTYGEGEPEPQTSKDAPTPPAGPAVQRGRGGPDAFGYSWIDSNEPGGPVYAWVDIAATGTALTLGDDASSAALPLGFAFPFYGVDQTTVFVSSNGLLTFGASSTAFTNAAIPTAATPNNFIAPFWDDLDPGDGNGAVYYQAMGDGRFIVQYEGVPDFPGPGAGTENTFQVILSQGGAILFQYEDMNGDLVGSTVGIENPDGTDGLQVAFNQAYVADGLAVRFSALWVDANPTAGLVPAGGTSDVTLTFDSAGLAVGTYNAVMTVTTNDPQQPSVDVPVTFNVGTVAAGDPVDAFEGTHRLSAAFPNPASSGARLTLAVAEAQTVRVELYDALGRRVALLHDGALGAREAVTLDVPAAGLAAGAYVVRVAGETFADARRLTVTH